jgi:hypothetical protein
MHRSLRDAVGVSAILLLGIGLGVQGCQEDPTAMVAGPELASVVSRTLKVSGGGTGGGAVSAPAVGGAEAMDCRISGGTYDPIDCTASYAKGTTVTLTATPDPGSAFKEWRNACTSSAPTCTVRMDQNRSVRAVFRAYDE